MNKEHLVKVRQLLLSAFNKKASLEDASESVKEEIPQDTDRNIFETIWDEIVNNPTLAELTTLKMENSLLLNKNNQLEEQLCKLQAKPNYPSSFYDQSLQTFPSQLFEDVKKILEASTDLKEFNSYLDLEISNYKSQCPGSRPASILLFDLEGKDYPLMSIHIVADKSLDNYVKFLEKGISKRRIKFKSEHSENLNKSLEYLIKMIQKENYPPEGCADRRVEQFQPTIKTPNNWNDVLWAFSIYAGIYVKTQESLNHFLTVRCCEHDSSEDYRFLKV